MLWTQRLKPAICQVRYQVLPICLLGLRRWHGQIDVWFSLKRRCEISRSSNNDTKSACPCGTNTLLTNRVFKLPNCLIKSVTPYNLLLHHVQFKVSCQQHVPYLRRNFNKCSLANQSGPTVITLYTRTVTSASIGKRKYPRINEFYRQHTKTFRITFLCRHGYSFITPLREICEIQLSSRY